ncbi:MAG: guanylate kinase [Candidatus Coatesbacteria bacterium]|nr:guanylate kinase [Candidatus Coatesbacteria bacterium]
MQPAPAQGTIEQRLRQAASEGRIAFVLSGPAGAGKTTVARRVTERHAGLALNVSCTTRPPRAGETTGSDYHFISAAEFRRLADSGEMLESARVHDHFYGTRINDVIDIFSAGKDALLEIDIQGGFALRDKYERTVLIFMVAPTFADTVARLVARGSENEEQLEIRIKRAKEEIAASRDYDYLVVNDDIDRAALSVLSIMASERLRMTNSSYQELVDEMEEHERG